MKAKSTMETKVKTENNILNLQKESNKLYNIEPKERTRAKSIYRPKDSMGDILTESSTFTTRDNVKMKMKKVLSSRNLIRKKQMETNFKPDYNKFTVNDIKDKITKTSAVCVGKNDKTLSKTNYKKENNNINDLNSVTTAENSCMNSNNYNASNNNDDFSKTMTHHRMSKSNVFSTISNNINNKGTVSKNNNNKNTTFTNDKASNNKEKESLFNELNPKERRIKSIYPDLSGEEVKLLLKSKKVLGTSSIYNKNSIEESNKTKSYANHNKTKTFIDPKSAKTQRVMQNSSNIFNNSLKQSLNKTHFEKMKNNNELNRDANDLKKSTFKNNCNTKPSKNTFNKLISKNNEISNDRLKNKEIKTTLRAKSARERKIEELTSNIIIGDNAKKTNIATVNTNSKGSLLKSKSKINLTNSNINNNNKDNNKLSDKENAKTLIRSKTQFFKTTKQNSIYQNLSSQQGTKFLENTISKISQNNTVVKHFLIKNIKLQKSEKEIKNKLAAQGIHVAKMNINYDIVKNSDIDSVEISLRTNPKTNNLKFLKGEFAGSVIKETFISDKPFLAKKKCDIISGKLDMLDTKLSQKYGKRDLEGTRNQENKVNKLDR